MLERGQRARDWHYLGAKQWDYNRELARSAGCMTDELDRFLRLNQQVYEVGSSAITADSERDPT